MNLLKSAIATAAVITCSLPAQASDVQNKAILLNAGITCKHLRGELNFGQATTAMTAAFSMAGVPARLMNAEATTTGAAEFIKKHGCDVFN